VVNAMFKADSIKKGHKELLLNLEMHGIFGKLKLLYRPSVQFSSSCGRK
jgi:hypothetical protein